MNHFLSLAIRYAGMIIVLFFDTDEAYSQYKDSSYAGIYLTEKDFLDNRLSYKINTDVRGYKLNFPFPADFRLKLKITMPDTSFKFPRGSIYGYTQCGNLLRYFEGGAQLNAQEDFYKVEESGSLIIYSSVFISWREIFYSTGPTSPIHRLTLQNLKKDFKDHPEFIAAAKKLKKQPDGLATRDKTGGLLINKLYHSLENNNHD